VSVLIDSDTRVVVQGITGHQGRAHTRAMLEFGTRIVAGVTPGKGGEKVHGVPVYDTVEEAMVHSPDVSISFVPARWAFDAAVEAIEAGIRLLVIVAEHVPLHDELRLYQISRKKGARVVGPNCPGIASPGKSKVGIMPNRIFMEGNVGVVSRSGTLTYEVVNALSRSGLGQSTCIGVGGDRAPGTSLPEAFEMLAEDPKTDAIVVVGEIGGSAEERTAALARRWDKPVVAYIAGRSAPPHRRMGHAGALVEGGAGTARSKIEAFERAGAFVAKTPLEVPMLVKEALKG